MFWIEFFLVVILTELFTELFVKSIIFKPVRDKIKSLHRWFDDLLSCGYCTSVWVAFGLAIVLKLAYPFTGTLFVDLPLTAFIAHRLSNFLHNFNDKWLDKMYDVRFINSEHDDSSEG